MTVVNTTQMAVEVAQEPTTTKVNTTQMAVEVAQQPVAPKAVITQMAIEVTQEPIAPKVVTTQMAAEVLRLPVSKVLTTQIVIEVLRTNGTQSEVGLIPGTMQNTMDYAYQAQPYIAVQLANARPAEEFVFQGKPFLFAIGTGAPSTPDAIKRVTQPTVFICT